MSEGGKLYPFSQKRCIAADGVTGSAVYKELFACPAGFC